MKSPISRAHMASTRLFSPNTSDPEEIVILSGAKDLLFPAPLRNCYLLFAPF
jgi:hypothetical protein